jgi:hypothetical protein
VVLHDRTSGDGDGFWGPNASTGEVWGMEVGEPSSNFIRRGVGKKEADLTFNMLPLTVNTSGLQSEMKAYSR